MFQSKRLLLVLVVVALGASSGAMMSLAQDGLPDVARSDRPRNTAPQVAPEAMEQLSQGNRAFAFDLYRQLASEPGNLFLSPYSITTALAMTHAGARGETERQMASTLHFGLPQDQLHPALNNLALELERRPEQSLSDGHEGFRLNVANSVWAQQNYQFLPAYLDLLAENYGSEMRLVDFQNELEPTRLAINTWVSEATETRIPEMLTPGVLTSATRLVLVNAIYFKASWATQFESSMTRDEPFHLTADQGPGAHHGAPRLDGPWRA
jgi:serpin B